MSIFYYGIRTEIVCLRYVSSKKCAST